MRGRRVVITGLGAITPLGCSVAEYWNGLIAGRSGIGPLTKFDASRYDTRIAGQCTGFDVTRWVDGRFAKRLDPFAQYAVAAADDATKDSGLNIAREDPYRIGVMIGSGIGGIQELQEQYLRLINKGPSRISAFTIPKLMVNAGAGNVAIHLGTQGPSSAAVTACASASHAMGEALRCIQRDEADVVIAGGSEAAVTELAVAAFNAMHALSTRNDEPQKASRPFDKDRDGFVISEGAGVLVFEELEHARKRSARIYAEVIGFGMTTDGGHITQPDEHGACAAEAMRRCFADAQIGPSDIDYINAHGTSTTLGDIAETRAIKQVLGADAYKVPVSSTKSATGHLLGASGGIELVAGVMAIHDGILPPTLNLETPDPECDLDYVPNKAREVKVRRILSNSFGFGGHNACIIVEALS